jgi:hypothetical protein
MAHQRLQMPLIEAASCAGPQKELYNPHALQQPASPYQRHKPRIAVVRISAMRVNALEGAHN